MIQAGIHKAWIAPLTVSHTSCRILGPSPKYLIALKLQGQLQLTHILDIYYKLLI